jgi:hypothetical protein
VNQIIILQPGQSVTVISPSIVPPPSSSSGLFFGHDLMYSSYFTPGHFPLGPFDCARLWDCGVTWREIEKSRGAYDWHILDAEAAKLKGKKIIYVFGKTPRWASMRPDEIAPNGDLGGAAPPSDIDSGGNVTWKNFITALATRYKGQFDYEGFNEASGAYKGAYWTGTIPQLVRMQSDAFSIIRSIDPNALVAGPSVDGESNQFQWLDSYLAAGGGRFQDAVTFHAYLHDGNPDPAPTLTSWLNQFRSLMFKHGINGQQLWQTEGSFAHGGLGPGPLSPEGQANYTAQSMLLGWAAGVSRWVHYSYENQQSGTLWNNGLLPAGRAYEQLYGWLTGATLTAPATKASDGTWSVGLMLASGKPAKISWKPNAMPVLS